MYISIHQWEERAPLNKAHCLDFGDHVLAKDVEDSLEIGTGIVPMFGGDMSMRDYLESNGVWAKIVRLLRAKFFDRDLQIPDHSFRVA